MKNRLFWFLLCLMLPAASQMRLAAQSCISFIPNYASYNNISTDGTNIYTSVVVDGSGEMIFNGGNGCGSINYGTIVHWPAALNVISIPGSSTYVGGMLSGAQVCPDCYLSETNNQSVPATPGVNYSFQSEGAVICSLAGAIFSVGWPNIQVEIAYTKSKWNNQYTSAPLGAVQCFVSQYCSVATQPPICNPGYVIQEPLYPSANASCWRYYNSIWLAESYNNAPWTCIPLAPGENAVGTTDSTVGTCTH